MEVNPALWETIMVSGDSGRVIRHIGRLDAAVRQFRRIAAERVIHYREEEMLNAERAWQEIVDYADAALKEDA